MDKKVQNFAIEMDFQTNKDIIDFLHSYSYRCMQLCSPVGYNIEEYQVLMNGFRRNSSKSTIIPPCEPSGDVWCW